MKYLCTIFFLFLSQSLFAYENDYALKVAGYYSVSNITNIKIGSEPPMGLGISTHVGYRYTKWEFNFSSYLNFARFKDVRVRVNDSNVHGDGTLQSVTFGPTVRYYDLGHYNNLIGTPYFAAGIHTIVQTFRFGLSNVEVNGGRFNGENNLNTLGYGTLLAVGFDKSVGNNKKKNFFIELAYSANQSKRKSEVESTTTQVRLIQSENSKQAVYEQTFFLGVGLTLF